MIFLLWSGSDCGLAVWQARSWPRGSGGSGPLPPELLRMTFLNRVNPETFVGGRGRDVDVAV